nr:MAG TPA: hypothetical protein [Caudoviricetes sp.]
MARWQISARQSARWARCKKPLPETLNGARTTRKAHTWALTPLTDSLPARTLRRHWARQCMRWK